uniref:Uncharacterized protein n=1 Tax=Tanacetum cinerariifolium TaxID=118510 RepID=A0A699IX98_TANCI|nr:hypothetical protein [Tanacetum cinerariifolium]
MEICVKLSDRVLSLEKTKTNQAAEIKKLKKRVKKLEGKKKKRTHELKRLYKGRINEEDLFGVHDLSGDEVFVDVTAGKNVKQDATVAKKFSTADPVTTAGEVVTAAEKEFSIADPVTTPSEVFTGAEDVEVAIAATITQISKDELTLAQILMEMKAAKPKAKGVTIQEPKPKKPLKMKDQIALDEEVARKLEAEMKAEMEEEERIARDKVEANIAMIIE